MNKEYLVQPKQYGERKADYKKGDVINTKWKSISAEEAYDKGKNGFCGNVSHAIKVNPKTKRIKFVKTYSVSDENNIDLSETISSALALYRMICMIKNPIVETEGAEGYKVPWSLKLIHVETGEILGFSEWKGAFGIWTKFNDIKDLPVSFKNDLIEILNFMLSDKSPHPYDGCTAGSVA